MGSFFNGLAKIDPIQQLAGRNSFIAKMDSYDPIMKHTDLGQAYAGRNQPGAGYVAPPTPYAGQTPTLQDANNGYVQAAQRATQAQVGRTQSPQNPQQQWSY